MISVVYPMTKTGRNLESAKNSHSTDVKCFNCSINRFSAEVQDVHTAKKYSIPLTFWHFQKKNFETLCLVCIPCLPVEISTLDKQSNITARGAKVFTFFIYAFLGGGNLLILFFQPRPAFVLILPYICFLVIFEVKI